MHKFFLLLLCASIVNRYTQGFGTLSNACVYAQAHEEYPVTFGQNVLNPDYRLLYKQLQPPLLEYLLSRLLSYVGISRPHTWSADIFKTLLIDLVRTRENNGYKGEYILKITAPAQAQCIIFGSVSSSFHSLMRDLQELKRMGIINEQLEILKPHHYIFFNGNVINGSPYILETLTLVMELMVKNPDRVWYIRGQQEDKLNWQNSGLKRELQAKAYMVSQEKVPLERYINRFFDTLPLAVYIGTQNPDEGLIRISYFGRDNLEVNEAACASVLRTATSNTVEFCHLDTEKIDTSDSNKQTKRAPELKAIVKAERRLMNFTNYTGLAQIEPDKGTTAWVTLSGPTYLYKEHFNFVYDSFVVVTFGRMLKNSTITVYYQDVRNKKGFIQGKTYVITSGRQLAKTDAVYGAEKAEEPLIVGCTLDFTKGLSALSKQLRAGVTLRINKQNQEGGINGRPIRIVYMDDEYTPELARRNIEKFVREYKSTLILSPVGSPTLEAYLDLIKEKKIFVFFPVAGAPIFRTPELTNIVHWMASYTTEAEVVTRYSIKEEYLNAVAFLYQNDTYGQAGLIGGRKAAKQANITHILELPYERNITKFQKHIEKFKQSAIHGLGFFATSFATMEFIRQIGVEYLNMVKLFGISDLSEDMFQRFIKQKGLPITISNFVPNPQTSNLEFVQECRMLVRQVGGISLDVFVLQGYLSADLFISLMQQIKGTITHEKIRKVICSIKHQPYKGLTLNYNPQTQELSNKVWLDTGESEWLEQKVD